MESKIKEERKKIQIEFLKDHNSIKSGTTILLYIDTIPDPSVSLSILLQNKIIKIKRL